MGVSRHRQRRLVGILAAGALLCAWTDEAGAQDAEHVTITGQTDPSHVGKLRFRIAWGISNTEYRQQALALTPLGTRYERMKTFVFQEWRLEERKLTAFNREDETGLSKSLPVVTRDLLQEQAPHIAFANTDHAFVAGAGRSYVHANLIYKPVRWRPAICVTIVYVFDKDRKLIDLFCQRSTVRGYNPWAEF